MSIKGKNSGFGFATLLLAAFIYSLFNIFFRVIGYELPLFYQSAVRSLLMSAGFLLMVLGLKKWRKVQKPDIKWIVGRGVGGIMGYIGYYVAVNSLTISTVYLMFYGTGTIGGYIVGKILFAEKLSRWKIISLVLACVGLSYIYTLNFEPEKLIYLGFAIASGIGWSVWFSFSKTISHKYSALQLNMWDSIISTIIYFPASILFLEQWTVPSASRAWLANGGLALSMMITAQLVVYGFRHLEVQIGSLVMLSEILWGVLIGIVIYGEFLSRGTIWGGLLIIIAIIMPKLKITKKPGGVKRISPPRCECVNKSRCE